MKKIFALSFIISIAIPGLINQANATHLSGGEITWTCVGQDSFLINLVIYGDCNSGAVATAPIVFKCSTTGSNITTVTAVPGSGVDITPVCRTSCTRCQSKSCSFPYGINKYTIQCLVNLNSAGSCCQVTASWEQCCRTSAISTFNGSAYNLHLTSTLNRCQNPCDNSPSFSTNPSTIFCVGQDAIIDFSAYDIGSNPVDSFTYEMTAPLQLAGNAITYTGQYTYDKPIYFWSFPNDALPFPRGFHLDAQSGIMQFRPMKAEVSVVVVKVNEFRNGTKIAEIRRDIQVILITCAGNNPPNIITPGNIKSRVICLGDTIKFDFQTGDPNTYDTVTLSWSNNIPGAVWSDSNGFTKHPSATFTWVPTASQTSTQPYYFKVIASDNSCPLSAQYSQQYQVIVKANVSGNYTVTKLSCGNYLFNATATQGSGFPFLWRGDINYNSPNFIHHFKQPGKYYFSFSTSSNYFCGNTVYDSIITDSFLSVQINGYTSPLCYGNSVSLDVKASFSKGKVKYKWNTGDTVAAITVSPLTSTWYKVEVSDSSCMVRDSVLVQVEIPVKVFYDNHDITDTISCIGSNVYIQGYSNFGSYQWNTGETNYGINRSNVKPTWYKLVATDYNGCISSDSVFVDVYPDPHVNAGRDTGLCDINGRYELIGYPDSKSGGTGYWTGAAVTQDISKKWYFNITDATIQNLSFNTLYYYYTDTFGCLFSDYIRVRAYKYSDISAGKDSSLCLNANPIFLTGIPSGGYWQGDGVNSQKFDPVIAGAGKHLLTYNIDVYCLFTDTSYITVFPLPVIQLSTSNGKTEFCPQGLIDLNGSPSGGLYGGKWSGDVDAGHYFNTNRKEGIYSAKYTYTDNNGCSNSDSMTLKVSMAKVNIDTKQQGVCFGKSILLKANFNFANSFLWTVDSSSDGYFNGNTHNSELYFIPGQNDFARGGFHIKVRTFSNICNTDTDSIYIRTGYYPKTGFSADILSGNIPLYVTFTDSSTIKTGNITGYYWDFGDGNYSVFPNPSNMYQNTGSYNVRLTTISDIGCRDSLIKNNYISTTNSIPEIFSTENFRVIPNPANDLIVVSSSNKTKIIAHVMLYDASGTLIYQQNSINQNSLRIDLINFKPGLYLMRVVSDKGIEFLARFVKE
jgi:hypothetical protein